jgi:hypothetical protein
MLVDSDDTTASADWRLRERCVSRRLLPYWRSGSARPCSRPPTPRTQSCKPGAGRPHRRAPRSDCGEDSVRDRCLGGRSRWCRGWCARAGALRSITRRRCSRPDGRGSGWRRPAAGPSACGSPASPNAAGVHSGGDRANGVQSGPNMGPSCSGPGSAVRSSRLWPLPVMNMTVTVMPGRNGQPTARATSAFVAVASVSIATLRRLQRTTNDCAGPASADARFARTEAGVSERPAVHCRSSAPGVPCWLAETSASERKRAGTGQARFAGNFR